MLVEGRRSNVEGVHEDSLLGEAPARRYRIIADTRLDLGLSTFDFAGRAAFISGSQSSVLP